EGRAAMLKRLGFTKLAYDWRAEHVPEFEAEIKALKEHDIDFFAFWGLHEDMFRLFEKHGIHPQVWLTVPDPGRGSREEKVRRAGTHMLDAAKRTQELGCKLGLYNHGGWGGEPMNMVAVCKWLRKKTGSDHIGIVYNLHHGHEHIDDFAACLDAMKPYLLCLNLNGMNTGAEPKILPIGQGEHDRRLLCIILDSGYTGPIGILDHRPEVDAETSLRENLEGLEKALREIAEAEGGHRD
ncbi:MAG: TIM barrel protein, partial [Candidatus Hydrogenedentota bacterium]